MNEREAAIEAVALLQAHARTQGSVYMDGKHNPLPTEMQKAQMFVEDHIDPLQVQLDEALELIQKLDTNVNFSKLYLAASDELVNTRKALGDLYDAICHYDRRFEDAPAMVDARTVLERKEK